MQLVEHHRISRSDPRFAALDAAAFASKNLYNVALYTTRQAYIFRGEIITCPGEAVGKRSTYAGKRVHRGLFRTASGRRVNADINAAYNQIINVAPDAFGPGRRGCVVQPGRIALPNLQAVR